MLCTEQNYLYLTTYTQLKSKLMRNFLPLCIVSTSYAISSTFVFVFLGAPEALARLVIYSKQGILSPKRGYDEDAATSRTATHGPNDVPRPGPTALHVLGLGFYPSRAAGWEKVPHRVQRWSAVERTRRHTDTHSYQHTGCLWPTATFPTINITRVEKSRR